MSLIRKLNELASRSAVIMLSRLAGAGVGFLTQILLVKLMGANHLGLFYAASSLAAVLGVIVAQGYPQVAARFVGRYRNKRDDALFANFTRHAMREGFFLALAAALAVNAWALAWPGLGFEETVAFCVAGWMLLAIVTLNILTNIAGGMRIFSLCYMPEGMLRPLLFFAAVALMGLTGVALSAHVAMITFSVITALLAGGVAILLRRQMPQRRPAAPTRVKLAWRWRTEAWQLVLLAVFTNFFADVGILVAAPFLSHSETAVFGLCLKLALLVGYFVQIGQQMAVPDMADARHGGDMPRLRRAAWRSIAAPSVITGASMLAILVSGTELLSYFGSEFAAGKWPLMVLLAAQLLRALAGPSAHMLTLSGIQRVNFAVACSSLLVLFAASAGLSPAFGVEGAAAAVLVAYAYWIGISAFALKWLKEPSVDILWLTFSRNAARTA
jgi:O-antigen/teichoic acid export membrane protein